MSDPNPRRYDDSEVSRIFQRASELQEEKSEAPAVTGGMTEAELVDIGSDVGIDRALVRRAIRELEAPDASSPRAGTLFLGAPATIRFDRVVDGEVAPAALKRMQMDIEAAAESLGHSRMADGSLHWQSAGQDGTRFLRVQVESEYGETRIMIEERQQNLAWGLFGGIIGGVGGGVGLGGGLGVGLGALGSVHFAIIFATVVFLGSYLLARGIFSSMAGRRERALAELSEQLADYPKLEE